MGSLSAAIAAGQQEIERRLLKDTCEIRRSVETRDPVEGVASAFQTTSTVKCLVNVGRLAPRDVAIADQLRSQTIANISMPANTDLLKDDQIFTTRDGATYEVVGVPTLDTVGLALTVTAVRTE